MGVRAAPVGFSQAVLARLHIHGGLLQVQFSPLLASDGSTALSVVGAGTFKVFRVADPAGLKPLTAALGRHSFQNFTCHLWLADGEHLDERGQF